MLMVGVVPYGIALFAIVMLLTPKVPLCPVTVKAISVLPADWLALMVTLDICEAVMLPLRVRVMFVPSFLVA
jgi:hypothetical protein